MSEKKNSPEAVSEFLSDEGLDRMLAEMAQETPDVPDGFHERWTEKVREEAAAQPETEKRKEGRRQWRYILGAAAVFVFLIGGTLLTRDHGADLAKNSIPAAEETESRKATALLSAAGPDAEEYAEPEMAEETAEAAEEAAEPEMFEEMAEAAEEDAGPEFFADMAAGAAANAIPEVFAAQTAALTLSPIAVPTGTPDTVPAVGDSAAALPAAKNAEPEEAVGENGWIPEENTAVADAEAGTAEEPAEEADEAPEAEDGFVDFLKDLGIFTLKTLAVAAVAALLAFGAAAVHKAWKKRKR